MLFLKQMSARREKYVDIFRNILEEFTSVLDSNLGNMQHKERKKIFIRSTPIIDCENICIYGHSAFCEDMLL